MRAERYCSLCGAYSGHRRDCPLAPKPKDRFLAVGVIAVLVLAVAVITVMVVAAWSP